MGKIIMAMILLFVCPPIGIIASIAMFRRKTVYFSPGNFQPAGLESEQKDQPTIHIPENSSKEMFKPGYDPMSPENRERTLFLNRIVEENREKADRELLEEIRLERVRPPKKTVENIMNEHRAKMARRHAIDE